MTLSDRQFRLMRDTYTSPFKGNPAQRNYRLVDKRNKVHADMSVLDYPNTPTERTAWNSTDWNARDINAYSDGRPREGQHRLFEERYSGDPGTSKLNNAAMTKGVRAMAMPMLAQAAYDTAEQGRRLKPSENLSAQSAPLVARLQQRGLVDENAVTSASNGIGFMEETWPLPHVGSDAIREKVDLGQAKKMGRSILKHTRVPKPQSVEQTRLFD